MHFFVLVLSFQFGIQNPYTMKKNILLSVIIISAIGTISWDILSSNGKAGATGSPGENDCSTSCHTGTTVNAGPGSITISSSPSLSSGYTPATTYAVSVTVAESLAPNNNLFGFGFEALLASGVNGGSLVITNPTLTTLKTTTVGGNVRNNVVHTGTGNTGPNSQTFTFNWTSPASGSGTVTFYTAGIAANNNGNKSGDHVYKTSLAVPEATSSVSVSTTATNASCNSSCTGTATATPSGGTSPFAYLWSNNQITQTATGLCAGTYTVTVTDFSFSTDTSIVTIAEPSAISLSVSSSDVSCFGANTGTATVAASGGTSGYSYLWSNAQTAATATGLGASTYFVTVTDANSCTAIQSVTVSQPSALSASVASSNASCNGICDGTLDASGSGGTAPYSYSWSGGLGSGPGQTNVCSGTYYVTIADSNGCTATDSAVINEPQAISLTPFSTNASCGSADGSAGVIATGGASPYSYLWSNGGTTPTLTGLATGSYSVTVTDTNNCTQTSTVSVTTIGAPVVNASVQNDVTCNGGNDGSATVSVSGGVSPYTFLWADGQTTQTATGLSSGNINITVTDSNSCSGISSVSISEPSPLSTSVSATDVSCYGLGDGSVTVTPSGGVSGYTYLWSNSQTSATVTGLVAGNYSVTVTDANNCTFVSSSSVAEPAELLLSTSSTNSGCGVNDGTASAIVSGGTAPYSFLWSDGNTSSLIDSLAPGSYSVTVTDSGSCSKTAIATVSASGAPTVNVSSQTDVTCSGGNNGSAALTVSGGATPYSFFWSDGQTLPSATGLSAGTIDVTITDAAGCSSVASATINEPSPVTVVISSLPAGCGSADGSATAAVSGGSSPYSYLWSTGSTDSTATGLSAGPYSLTVTDFENCTQTSTAVVGSSGSLAAAISVQSNVTCNGGSNGNATVSVSGGNSPYSFAWSNGQASQTATGLSAGNYSVSVTDGGGCISIASVSISQPAALASTVSSANVNCYGGNNGTATVSVSGGTTPYSYLWSNSATTSSVNNLTAGNYTVIIIDANNCNITATVTVSQPTLLSTSIYSTGITCNGGNNGMAAVTATGGTSPYTYNWSNSQNTMTATGLQAGTYSVTATDFKGCTSVSAVTISEPAALSMAVSTVNISCNGGSNGIAMASVSGGTGPYSFQWSDGQVTSAATGLPAGNFSVTVTDANGCFNSSSGTITEPAPISVSVSTTPSVDNNCAGTGTVSAGGGTPSYSYLWSNGSSGPTAGGLCGGNYTVTVTDANGCTYVTAVLIEDSLTVVIPEENLFPEVNFFPNPNDGNFLISFVSRRESTFQLSIISILGEVVQSEMIKVPAGETAMPVSMDNKAKGIYTLQLSSGEFLTNKMLIVK